MLQNNIIKPRTPWIDNCKAIVMLCVIIGHVSSLLEGSFRLPTGNTFVLTLMPAFVLLSGYCNLGSMKRISTSTDIFNYIKKLLVKLKLPAVVIGSLYFPLTLRIRELNPVISRFWFIDMLLVLLISMAVIKFSLNKIPRVSEKYILHLISLIFLLIMLMIPYHGICDLAVFFVVGLYMRRYDLVNRFANKVNCLILICITALSYYVYDNYYNELTSIDYSFYRISFLQLLWRGEFYIYLWRIYLGLLLCSSLITIVYLASKKYTYLSFCGSRSLFVYMFHIYIIFIIGFFKDRFCIDMLINYCSEHYLYSLFIGVLMSVLIYFICIVLSEQTKKNKVTRILFGLN